MTSSSRALHRFFLALALPMLAVPFAANTAPVAQKAKPRVAVRKPAAAKAAAAKPAVVTPVAANNAIIPLPLNPIVPATQRLCAARTASGLGYTMLRAGTGTKPGADATVLLNYIGYLASSGAVFDQNTRTPLGVSGVIQGFGEGLQMVARNGVVRLCIPAALGYGAQESGPIPANSDLVFQVEVLDFRTAAEIEEMRKARAAADTAPAESALPKEPGSQP